MPEIPQNDEALIQQLLQAARDVQKLAYAKYSEFPVGAAIYTDKGRIITGCNVENASYGLTMCAERNAVGRAVAEEAGQPLICVVIGPTREPLAPCGACRQVLREFNGEMRILCYSEDGQRADFTIGELLPDAFNQENLAKARIDKG